MKVLLIGGEGSLINSLTDRFYKEGHRIFRITGARFKKTTNRHVFEQYDFPYDSPVIGEIFESADPDVVVFTGAFDPLFDWKTETTHTAVKYTACLLSLLMAFSCTGKSRFICLSSQEVFSGWHDGSLDETAAPQNTDNRGMALIEAENLCRSFRRDRGADVVILRLGTFCHCPQTPADTMDVVSQMCLDALRNRQVTFDRKHEISLLFERDVVQFVTQAAFAPDCGDGLYNIASDLIRSEEELAHLVAACAQQSGKKKDGMPQVAVCDSGRERKERVQLSNARFRSAFGINRFADPKTEIERILAYMRAHPDVFLEGAPHAETFWQRLMRRFGWAARALVPFLENGILFIPFFMLNNRAVGSQYFAKIDFYLLYVLLFAVVHGQQQAIVSAMLATAGYIFRQMYQRTGFDVILDYNTYIWIAQLFIVGLTVGYLHDTIRKLREEAAEDHEYMVGQLQDIRDINSSNVRVKDALETQVISQNDSVGKVYRMVSQLDRYNADEVLFYAAGLLKEMMGSEDIAIYTCTMPEFARLFTATSGKARSLGNSIRRGSLGQLSRDVSSRRVFINRSLDPDLPMMAGGVYRDDRILMVVMVWTLPWEMMTLGEADRLAVICGLIRDAVYRADRYLAALESRRFISGTRVLKKEAFSDLLEVHHEAYLHGLTEATLLSMPVSAETLYSRSEAVRHVLRNTDYIGTLEEGSLLVLLTNTNAAGASVVLRRLSEAGIAMRAVPFPEEGGTGGSAS